MQQLEAVDLARIERLEQDAPTPGGDALVTLGLAEADVTIAEVAVAGDEQPLERGLTLVSGIAISLATPLAGPTSGDERAVDPADEAVLPTAGMAPETRDRQRVLASSGQIERGDRGLVIRQVDRGVDPVHAAALGDLFEGCGQVEWQGIGLDAGQLRIIPLRARRGHRRHAQGGFALLAGVTADTSEGLGADVARDDDRWEQAREVEFDDTRVDPDERVEAVATAVAGDEFEPALEVLGTVALPSDEVTLAHRLTDLRALMTGPGERWAMSCMDRPDRRESSMSASSPPSRSTRP